MKEAPEHHQMDTIWQELGINNQHVCETSVSGRYQLICDKAWLQTIERKRKLSTFTICAQLDRRAHPEGPLEHPWTRILVQTYRKQPQSKVYPLPRGSDDKDCTSMPMSYSQAISYVAHTNFKQLWEESYKRYAGAYVRFCRQNVGASKLLSSPQDGLQSYDVVLKELIQRIYHCEVIHCKLDRIRDGTTAAEYTDAVASTSDCHDNVLRAIVAIETSAHINVFFYPPALICSLYDCITYSPAILNKSYNKPLFLLYQIFQLSKSLQAQGLFLGDLRLQNILLRDNLWLQILPSIEANMVHDTNGVDAIDVSVLNDDDIIDDVEDDLPGDDNIHSTSSTKFDLKFAYDLTQFTLREYTEMWCNGQLSNYDYLTILNNASGRSLTNPCYHHIMPWVTDFTARNGANWRDLSKSKYRLNKGDIHLDLMFTHAQQSHSHIADGIHAISLTGQLPVQQVPHHVSDFLSEITYFVYMARRTPQTILCAHVRPIWVPAEYPASIQRLQAWTPDECIPEFYSDPMIFKSIHEDLPDLELPTWATCPEDFICKHREALESQYVSERLHHWIDLNFGYKLSGKAAIKAKNVCLSMVDQHKELCQRGIVQLFTQPHPAKRYISNWFNKTAPRLSQLYGNVAKTKQINNSTRRLAKSTENLHLSSDANSTGTNNSISSSPRMSLRPSNDEQTSGGSSNFYHTTNFIELPKDYNPIALLQSLETMQGFFARTFPKQEAAINPEEKFNSSDLLFDDNSEHSFTNQLFANETTVASSVGTNARKSKNLIVMPPSRKRLTLKQLLNEKRERELQVLGCLIVELFVMQRLRPLLMNGGLDATFEARLQACRTVAILYKQELPKCLRYIVHLLLFEHQQNAETAVTALGLPPPTTAQMLEPIFATSLIPFPNSYYAIYALIRSLHAFDSNSTLLELQTHFNCNGRDCSKYTDIDRKRVLYERKIAECKVMSCYAHIRRLLEPIAYEQFSPVELLLPHIIDLLSDEQTSILTAWNLFDPVAQALGVVQTQQHLLLPIMKLYDVECFVRGGMLSTRDRSLDSASGHFRYSTSSSFKSRKSVKLFHHSFLLRLIVRFGLRCFLQHFIAPLIEAVGGYKEPADGNGFHYHSGMAAAGGTADISSRRTSKNLNDAVDAVDDDSPLTLMSPEAEEQQTAVNALVTVPELKPEIEDVFSFDDDANSFDRISNSGTAENKSIDSFDMHTAPTAEEAKEEYRQDTPEKLAICEIIYGATNISSTSLDDDKISQKSQTMQDSPTSIVSGEHLGPKSPTIEIPTNAFRRSYQLSTIDCDIGSRKSVDSFEILTQAVESEQKRKRKQDLETAQDDDDDNGGQWSGSVTSRKITPPPQQPTDDSDDANDSLQASVISKMCEAKAMQNSRISQMSAESLVWLSHRLGPVLTSRYITRNLLKMLSLCYVGQENLLPETNSNSMQNDVSNLNYFTIADARVVGDRSAVRVLECLMSISALFGEEFILLQYFPHMCELIALCSKRITGSLEGALIGALQLLKYIVPCLMDATIMERLQDIFLDSILLPILRILGSTSLLLPNGYLGRSILARKFLDGVYVLFIRLGSDMSKEHLCQPLLRPFFMIFDKAYGMQHHFASTYNVLSLTPPRNDENQQHQEDQQEQQHKRGIEELCDVFGAALAHTAYLVFLRFLGEAIMQRTLVNLEFILTLCHEFEQPDYKSFTHSSAGIGIECDNDTVDGISNRRLANDDQQHVANSFGAQIVGNRLEVASKPFMTIQPPTRQELGPMEVLDMVAYKFEQLPTTRHLKGNWLAYWRHEITRSDKDNTLNLKQIRLQSFVGHTNSVRSIIALDNENSFITASKDKTVKLWSLRSEGDGKKVTSCQFTYTAHKKSIHSLSFLETMRFVVSCDSGVHIWDPFIGRPLGILDAPKHNPITVVKALPTPSPLIIAGTAESSVKIIDTRTMQYVNEWRLNLNTQNNATVRCVTVAPSGNWLAAGLSSGVIVMLDTRTGIVLNSWRPMECDLLQLAAPNDQQLISSALDHSLAVWHASNGILHYQLSPPAEPAHFLQTNGSELIFATTGNRIGVYSDIGSSHAAYSVTKLRSETFRGVLTSLAVLPLNRAFLAGNESGNIVLLC